MLQNTTKFNRFYLNIETNAGSALKLVIRISDNGQEFFSSL